VGLWQALFLLVLGWQVTRTSLFPLAYLYLAVPFGYSVIPALQDVTAQMVVHLLRLTGMPVFLDGYFIQIPSGSFLVAEACSGVRYLMVSVALGILAAYLFFQSWHRRLLFVGLSAVVPILANGIRAYGIVMLAHLSDYQLAVDIDHIFYGFLFLGIVTLTLLGFAALMRDRYGPLLPDSSPIPRTNAPTKRSMTRGPALQASFGATAIALVLVAQTWAAIAKEPPANLTPILHPAEVRIPWESVSDTGSNWTPRFHGNDVTLQQSYRRGGDQVDLHVAYYAYQREGAEAVSDRNTLVAKDWQLLRMTRAKTQVAGREHPYTRIIIRGRTETYVVWYWYWIGGQNTSSPMLGKLSELWALVTGGERAAAIIAIASKVSEDARLTDSLIKTFLDGNLGSDGTLVRAESSQGDNGTATPGALP
jgi:EpsI family protein